MNQLHDTSCFSRSHLLFSGMYKRKHALAAQKSRRTQCPLLRMAIVQKQKGTRNVKFDGKEFKRAKRRQKKSNRQQPVFSFENDWVFETDKSSESYYERIFNSWNNLRATLPEKSSEIELKFTCESRE